MSTFNETDKTAFIGRNVAAPAGGNSPRHFMVTVPITASASNFGWQNPLNVRGIASEVSVYFSTAGTGTIDVGTGTGGTGTNTAFIDGGTMAAGIRYAGGAGGTLGTAEQNAALIGASGSAGDSVVINHNEAATGTAVGILQFNFRVLE